MQQFSSHQNIFITETLQSYLFPSHELHIIISSMTIHENVI